MAPHILCSRRLPRRGTSRKKILNISVINGVFRGTLKISELRMPSDVGQLALRKFFCPRIYTIFRLTAKGVKSEKSEVSERLGETRKDAVGN